MTVLNGGSGGFKVTPASIVTSAIAAGETLVVGHASSWPPAPVLAAIIGLFGLLLQPVVAGWVRNRHDRKQESAMQRKDREIARLRTEVARLKRRR